MTTSYWPTTRPAAELPPIAWQPVPPINRIPVPEVVELPLDTGWQQFVLATNLIRGWK